MARILFVEDDPDVRTFVVAALEQAGHAVAMSPNGLDALAKLGGGPFDLVILDLLLPTLSGWEVLDRLRGDPLFAATRVLVTSALSPSAAQLGGHPFLRKPFELSTLVATVDRTIRARATA